MIDFPQTIVSTTVICVTLPDGLMGQPLCFSLGHLTCWVLPGFWRAALELKVSRNRSIGQIAAVELIFKCSVMNGRRISAGIVGYRPPGHGAGPSILRCLMKQEDMSSRWPAYLNYKKTSEQYKDKEYLQNKRTWDFTDA
ncbi:hypothetical protein EYF80_040254 [Liparis tanakae]|uniref:Uncharacterized protein n=1 Tax=Liparis tanakae TaxID=230148 RepID=A0A4Z2G7K0_9TELE|nr:hypothetical protein EYF80_040254 [Liparis tanakae]